MEFSAFTVTGVQNQLTKSPCRFLPEKNRQNIQLFKHSFPPAYQFSPSFLIVFLGFLGNNAIKNMLLCFASYQSALKPKKTYVHTFLFLSPETKSNSIFVSVMKYD
jgi:hypothetical protein